MFQARSTACRNCWLFQRPAPPASSHSGVIFAAPARLPSLANPASTTNSSSTTGIACRSIRSICRPFSSVAECTAGNGRGGEYVAFGGVASGSGGGGTAAGVNAGAGGGTGGRGAGDADWHAARPMIVVHTNIEPPRFFMVLRPLGWSQHPLELHE